ncbi:MAG TPA: NlpC/P60 family protein, partial [Gemmatimonadales bacterium]
WGGRTEWGIDCSGFAQAVYAARGVALLRDSDQQVTQGREVAITAAGEGYVAGDLLFFAEEGKVSHVALWLGAGRVAHSALSRGGVAVDALDADTPLARRLRQQLVAVRRMT